MKTIDPPRKSLVNVSVNKLQEIKVQMHSRADLWFAWQIYRLMPDWAKC